MTTSSVVKSLNSAEGKGILARIRAGDYAHPGEAEAVKLVVAHLRPCALGENPKRQILDLGCGLGGSAFDLYQQGFGDVVGVDIDSESLLQAQVKYPPVKFHCADAQNLSCLEDGFFDLVVLFTAFYSFSDQMRALQEMARVAKKGAELLLFDYTAKVPYFEERISDFASRRCHAWNPIRPETIQETLASSGWTLTRMRDLSAEFEVWYVGLLGRIELAKDDILQIYGLDWLRHVEATYTEILSLIREGVLGGALIYAKRN